MTKYTLTVTHPNDRAETITGTLSSLRSRLVLQAERWGWNYAGWEGWHYRENPGTFTLDDGETPPALAPLTLDNLRKYAAQVWDVPLAHVTIDVTAALAAERNARDLLARVFDHINRGTRLAESDWQRLHDSPEWPDEFPYDTPVDEMYGVELWGDEVHLMWSDGHGMDNQVVTTPQLLELMREVFGLD
jgi:hypothetical protein